MPIRHERCAGVDVHQTTVVAWALTPDGQGGWGREIRTCGPMTVEVLALSDGLLAGGGTPVASERTGDDWKPVFTILEGTGAVLLVNAQQVKAVPGRKTDGNDAAWLAELLRHGLWRARCSPPVAQRARRGLTRSRSPLSQARVTLVHRLPRRLEEAHSRLAAGASDLTGGSGRAILAALLTAPVDPQALAELAKGRLRRTRGP